MNENENGIKKNSIAVAIGAYLVVDIIVLFILCIIELNGVNHTIMMFISFILEFLVALYVVLKSDLKNVICFYILLLVSPVFIGLIAMAMRFFTDKLPFSPTVLMLFRLGSSLKGTLVNNVLRIVTIFRVPALVAFLVGYLNNKKNKLEQSNN